MLSDSEIIKRLVSEDREERIVISPMISASEQIGPSSVDVHLGTEFLVVERSDREYFDPLMNKQEYDEWLKHVRLVTRYSVLDPFVLHPWEFALACTLEFICLPRKVVGHIDGRSSWARQGLHVHATAGNIHPGSRGYVVFELLNVGPVPILLYPGLAIAQLTFELLGTAVDKSYSDRSNARYLGFRHTLWSAYLDDSILKAMRGAREGQEHRRPAPGFPGGSPLAGTLVDRFVDLAPVEDPVISTTEPNYDEFEQAAEYFEEHRSYLGLKYEGKYIAIKGEEIVDYDEDAALLSARTLRRFGDGPLYMPYATSKRRSPLRLPSPRKGFQS
jgi:dCTP deaminase